MKRIYMSLLMTLVSFAAVADPVTVELEAFSIFKDMNGGTFKAFSRIETEPSSCVRCGNSTYALKIPWYKDDNATWSSEDLGTAINDSLHVGFWVNFGSTGADPNTEDCAFDWVIIGPAVDDADVKLTIEADTCNGTEHKVCIRDANGNVIECTASDPFLDDTWYWIDFVFNQSNGSGWTSLWITQNTATKRTIGALLLNNGDDTESATAGERKVWFRSQVTLTGGSVSYWVKNLLIQESVSGVGADIGRFGMYATEINPYKNSVTPDCDEDGDTVSLDDLSAGNWDAISDDVLATLATYAPLEGGAIAADDDTSPGVIGPFHADDWENRVWGCRFGWRAGGVNPSGDNQLVWGKRISPANFVVDREEPAGCGRFCHHTKQVLPGTTYFPEAGQYAVMGFTNVNATSDVNLREARCWYFTDYPFHLKAVWDRPAAAGMTRGTNRGGG